MCFCLTFKIEVNLDKEIRTLSLVHVITFLLKKRLKREHVLTHRHVQVCVILWADSSILSHFINMSKK